MRGWLVPNTAGRWCLIQLSCSRLPQEADGRQLGVWAPWGDIYAAINHGETWTQGDQWRKMLLWNTKRKETGQPAIPLMLIWSLHGMERNERVEMMTRQSLLLPGTWETWGARPLSRGQEWAVRLLSEDRSPVSNVDCWIFNNCSASQQEGRTWDLKEWDKSGICLLEMSVLSVSCELNSVPLLTYSRCNLLPFAKN